MNQIANLLISALALARRDQAATARCFHESTPIRQLTADELRSIVGGDDQTGPRGGWKVAVMTTPI
jgi:hypothetical protein